MLASPVGETINFPVLASYKLDGIRCVIIGQQAFSRSLKLIPNKALQAYVLDRPWLEGFDGELMVFEEDGRPSDFQTVTSQFMSPNKDLDDGWDFSVFDNARPGSENRSYVRRITNVINNIEQHNDQHVEWVEQVTITDQAALDLWENRAIEGGYEGLMLRDPNGLYKWGRATTKSGTLLKLKRWSTDEAEVIGFVEQQHNGNAAEVNELGRTKRSSAKAGKTGMGVLGAIRVRDLKTGVEFEVGTGFTARQRADFWEAQDTLFHVTLRYRHFPVSGVKDAPRFPVFEGWRHADDLATIPEEVEA